ncbi:MAG TPA: D-alanyl-D-alanine carboxypeptidase, partial [Flavisolibacter sp.]|nr:D-alanyl-D-alanine carboxypeptidase [Flavisolibacter sp.]
MFIFVGLQSFEQDVTTKLTKEFTAFEADSQLKSAIVSFYVTDAKTGDVIFEKNATIGLAPASTQKIITACAAYELLGKVFLYSTDIGYSGNIKNGKLNGNLYLKGSGDPTLGSWRWKQTTENAVLERIANALKKTGIKEFNSVVLNNDGWEGELIPDGWIWQDVGNYYGAPATFVNWRENQYDLILSSGSNIGDSVKIIGTRPQLYQTKFISFVTSAG